MTDGVGSSRTQPVLSSQGEDYSLAALIVGMG